LIQVSDISILEKAVDEVMTANPKEVARYRTNTSEYQPGRFFMPHPLIAKQQGTQGAVVSPGISQGSPANLPTPSHENGDGTFQIEQWFDQLGQHQIAVLQPAEVRDYLLRYADMFDLVLSVCKSAREKFAAPTQLSLELYRDPEIEDEYLTLYVRQKNYEANILDTIENISAPFDPELSTKSGWLLVTTDFSPPR
jgi:hypothetical protein